MNYTFGHVVVTGFCFLSVNREDHSHRYYGAVTRGATNTNIAMEIDDKVDGKFFHRTFIFNLPPQHAKGCRSSVSDHLVQAILRRDSERFNLLPTRTKTDKYNLKRSLSFFSKRCANSERLYGLQYSRKTRDSHYGQTPCILNYQKE